MFDFLRKLPALSWWVVEKLMLFDAVKKAHNARTDAYYQAIKEKERACSLAYWNQIDAQIDVNKAYRDHMKAIENGTLGCVTDDTNPITNAAAWDSVFQAASRDYRYAVKKAKQVYEVREAAARYAFRSIVVQYINPVDEGIIAAKHQELLQKLADNVNTVIEKIDRIELIRAEKRKKQLDVRIADFKKVYNGEFKKELDDASTSPERRGHIKNVMRHARDAELRNSLKMTHGERKAWTMPLCVCYTKLVDAACSTAETSDV